MKNKIICFILILFSAYQLTNLDIGTDYRLFFGESNIDLVAFNQLEKKYGKNDTILIGVEPIDKNIFSYRHLQFLENITEELYSTPYSTRIDSITNYLKIESVEDEIHIGPLFDSEMHKDSSNIQEIKMKALSDQQLVGKIVDENGTITGINITIHIPKEKPNAVLESSEFIKEKLKIYERTYPDYKFYMSGIIIMNDAFATYMLKDLLTLTPMSNLIIFLVIAFLFKSFYVSALIVLISVLANITGMGFAGLTGIKLTPPSGMATIVILTLSIADCIHILTSLIRDKSTDKTWKEKVRYSVKKNFKSILLTSLTTAIGFLCLNFSDAPPYHDLGNIAAVGVVAAFLYSIVLFPFFLSLREPRINFIMNWNFQVITNFIIRRRKQVLFVSFIVCLCFIYFSSRLVINDTFANWFNERTEFRKNLDYVNENLTGLYTFEYDLEAKNDGSVFGPQYLNDLEKFNNWWLSKDNVWHVESINNIMKEINRAFNQNDNKFFTIPTKQDYAAQLFLFYEMGLPQGFDLNNRVSLSKKSSRMTVTFTELNSSQAEKLTNEAFTWLRENTTHIIPVKAQGPSIMFSNISRRNIDSMFQGTFIAFSLITLLLMFSLNSVRLGLISIFPNILPFVITFGIWQILYSEVGLAISIVTSTTIGIIIDDTIHIMTSYSREIKAGNSDNEALLQTLQSSGLASIVTSIVLSLGFSVMLFSDFLINFTFGLLSILSIVVAILFDIIVLPAILLTFIQRSSK